MQVHIKFLEPSDLHEIVRVWNEVLIHDTLDENKFRRLIFEDPDYEKEGNLVGIQENRIVAYLSAVVREEIKGKDGKGLPEHKYKGYIKCSFSLESYQDTEQQLLHQVLKYIKNKKKKRVMVGEYTGEYFFPGIDERYVNELNFYRDQGFQEIDTNEDLVLDLKDYEPTEYQIGKLKHIGSLGIKIIPYDPKYLDSLRFLVKDLNYPHWFPKGWDINYGKKGNPIIAILNDQVLGWAEFYPSYYVPDSNMGSFGPIAVLKKFRKKGIGSCLLMEALLQMKKRKVPKVYAGWAETPFYLKNGWKIARKYIVFEKQL